MTRAESLDGCSLEAQGLHVSGLIQLRSWYGTKHVESRKVRRAGRRLCEAEHQGIEGGRNVTDSAKLVELTAKVATGAEPQAHQRLANHVQAFHLTGLLEGTRSASSARGRADNRVPKRLPIQSHDSKSNELPDSGCFPPPSAAPRRASPSIH